MFGVFVENIDALAQYVVGFYGQQMLDLFQGFAGLFVHINDAQILWIASHDGRWQGVDHLFEFEDAL